MRRVARAGFSMMELVIAVAVIGIIAAVAIPRLGGAAQWSEEASLRANMRSGAIAVELCDSEHGVDLAHSCSEWFQPHGASCGPLWWSFVDAVDQPGVTDPAVKVFAWGGVKRSWYNRANRMFRAKVEATGGPAEVRRSYRWVDGLGAVAGGVVELGEGVTVRAEAGEVVTAEGP